MVIKGIVRDSISNEGIPYATILIGPDNKKRALTDERGIFEILVPYSAKTITATSQGYTSRTIGLTSSLGLYDINLQAEASQLQEVVITKKKYSKRGNPAVDFVRRLKSAASLTDPLRNDYYGYDRYEHISLGICDFDTTSGILMKKFPFISEHIDSSEISGRPVLNVSVKDKFSRISYRKKPKSQKEYVEGVHRRGLDDFVGQENVQVALDESFRDVDLYAADIPLLRNSFVSPLSSLGPDFYRYYLVDTVSVEEEQCIVLAFYPRNSASHGFLGHIYVPVADTTMMIKRVELRTHREASLNFIEELSITQTFERASDGSRLKTSDDLLTEIKFAPGTAPVYISRKITYKNHSFEQPEDSTIFNHLGPRIISDEAENRDSLYWARASARPIPKGEANIDKLMARLRQAPVFYWGEKVLSVLVNGYIYTGENSKFDIGPVNTLVSYNNLEGVRTRIGGMTTANLSPHWFARGYIARGFKDHKWKYSAELEYSFNKKKYHSREFPIHSLRFTHSYDLDRLGADYLFTNADNFVLSLTRMENNKDTYRRLTKLEYILELTNNFSIKAGVENIRQNESPYVTFTDYTGKNWSHFTENVLSLELRYAPGERYFQTKSYRFPVNQEAPIFTLRHRFAPKGFAGSKFAVNKTEFDFGKRFWLSILGSLEVHIGAGYVWSQSPFTELCIPNANLSYTIQPQSFSLMNPMEFINSSYASWDFTYRMHGALLGLIPGIKKLGLREVVGFRGLIGNLNKKNTPGAENPELFLFPNDVEAQRMNHGPYMEIAAGLDNVFRIIRLEYVWRLSYLDVPYDIDRRGLRIALHFTF